MIRWLAMHIDDDHMYHGAALTQIAERPEFKAINPFHDVDARGAFQINNDRAVYIKHASNTTKRYGEYVFTFNTKNLNDIQKLKERVLNVFIVLVCIKVKEICCLSVAEFDKLISRREAAVGQTEPHYTILVTAHAGQKFRIYVNQPGKKKMYLAQIRVSRSAFPSMIFKA